MAEERLVLATRCTRASGAGLGEPSLSSGAFAQALIQAQLQRLAKLQDKVLADREPEPLHQMRVSLRRLRTALAQFAPALVLPERVTAHRIAVVARRTGLCRDLDVLALRFQEQLLPRLPNDEQHYLEAAMQYMARERRQAFSTLVEVLRSRRYRKLLKRLSHWQQQPRFTPLGERPLMPWLVDWQAPFTAGLFLHPGWCVEDPNAEVLHELRKRIKQARYSVENLGRWCEPPLQEWMEDLRQAQDHLGELHDLQILQSRFAGDEPFRKAAGLPVLRAELENQQRLHWQRWRELALRLHQDSHRKAIQHHLLELGSWRDTRDH